MVAATEPVSQDVFLMPGDLFFGGAPARVSTLLGSCVSIVLWNPKRRIGGMCHYLLPTGRPRTGGKPGAYADIAMAKLFDAVTRAGSRPAEYRTTLVGGGHMFPLLHREAIPEVGERNVAAGRALLAHYRFTLHREDTGGEGHRHVDFDIATGAVNVRFELQPGATRCRSQN